MRSRVFILIALLFLKTVIGVLFLQRAADGSRIRLTGNVIKVTQTDVNCIIDFGEFVAIVNDFCKTRKGSMISVVGTKSFGLIEAIRGKIVVKEALFDGTDKVPDLTIRHASNTPWFVIFRNYCSKVYQRFLPSEEAALLAGIVLGNKDDIGYDFYQSMVRSGTVHIAVASGYNLMLVGGVTLSLLFWFFSRNLATIVTVVAMAFYAAMASFEPPVLRALVMACFIYFSQALGRKVSSVWSLVLSCWLLLVWDIDLLWSVSFQLSVVASVGLMVLAPAVQEYLSSKGLQIEGEWLSKMGLLTTVCTMLMTAPVIWFHFGRISIIGVFSNVFVLPLVPMVMILGVFMLFIPQLFYMPTYAVLHLIVLIIKFFGS